MEEGDELRVKPSTGGLATALSPVLRKRGGLWVGWPGSVEARGVDRALNDSTRNLGYELRLVHMTPEERDNFYFGFSNEIIWPLFHDFQTYCNFDPQYWITYETVNRKFAQVIARNCRTGDQLWVQDYHLMNVARELREQGVRTKVSFFLHIPFPTPDIFTKLPWRHEILTALLHYDLLGFQTRRDLRNFVQCAEAMLEGVDAQAVDRHYLIPYQRRRVRAQAFPISIDSKGFEARASSKDVEDRSALIKNRVPDRHFILGVDRLDYTKGITYKLEAFRRALERFPELRQKVTLLQILSPSREQIPQYSELKAEVEQHVGEINGEFSESGWMPIHYIHRNIDQTELLAWYRIAATALVTPLKDGMNLVAKEYIACQVEGDGALILSEFAGAAQQLKDGSLLVNPYDVEQVSDAIWDAFTMGPKERRERMTLLREVVREHDIHEWVEAFLRAAGEHESGDGNGRRGAAGGRARTGAKARPTASAKRGAGRAGGGKAGKASKR